MYYDGNATGTHDLQSIYDSFSGAPTNREGFNKGRGAPGPNPMLIDDQVVFGSCLMQGACGPTTAMIDTWIANMPSSMQTYLSAVESGKGIQRFTVPGPGTYRYILAGAFSTHDAYRYPTNTANLVSNNNLYNNNLIEQDRGGGALQNYTFPNTITGSTARGTPGVLEVEIDHAGGEVVDIMVGQRGGSAVNAGTTFNTASSGGGGSAIFIGGWNAWDKTTSGWIGAVAGGGAGNRNNSSQGTGGLSAYSTTGGAGDGGAGGTNGAGGGDNTTGGNFDSTSGAGLIGNGSQHSDQRQPPVININGRTAKAFSNSTRPGQGCISGAGYVNPYTTQSSGESLYIGIDGNGNVTSVGTGNPGYATADQTAFTNYADGTSNTLTSCQVPINCVQGGFGGGGVGNWGGCGGAGGYSGGGAGSNGNTCGGGGASYTNGMTYIGHTIASKTSDYNHWLSSNSLIWGGTNYGRTAKGSIIGNGEVVIRRIA